MTTEHFDKVLRTFQKRTPFQSFSVELVSGDRFLVDHPEALVVRAGVAVFISKSGEPVLFDHEGVCQIAGEGQPAAA